MRKAPPVREDSSARIAALMVIFAKVRDRRSRSAAEIDDPGALRGALHPTDSDKEQAAALMAAAEAGNASRVEHYLHDGIPCDILRAEAATELILTASQLGHAAVINVLARASADLEIMDEVRGGRPLMHAATNGHAAAAAALLKSGAEPEARDWNGYTALMIAVFSDRSTTAAALLENGAAVDAVDDKGRTSLCHAARYGSTDCIHVLAEHGADVFAVDEDGLNPLDIAEQNCRLGAAAALRKLEQRQRLQDKRLLRQKLDAQANSGGQDSATSKPALSIEEADLNMQALLRELEEDDHRQQEKKAAKKAKKKGKQGRKRDGCVSAGAGGKTAAGAQKPQGSDHCTSPAGKPGGPRGTASSVCTASSEDTMSDPGTECSSAGKPGSTGAGAGIRERWAALLDEAVNCKDLGRIEELVRAIQGAIAEVSEAGVSVKYGKKVLAKLGKVAPAKDRLDSLMGRPDSAIRPAELKGAIDSANSVRRHLDPGTLAEAEARLQRLLQEQEEAKWAKLKAELGLTRGRDNSHLYTISQSIWKGTGAVKTKEPQPNHVDTSLCENECIVCLAASKDAVLIPCGHICMCFDCSKQVQASSNSCPICRAEIDHAFQVL